MYAAAQVGFERMREVARRVGNAKLEGEALQNLANALYFQRNLPGALQAYEDRLTIERDTRRSGRHRRRRSLGIATIRYTFAEYATALTTYREALALQERLGDVGAIATTLISTGNVLYLQGEFSAAIADYTRSRDLNRKPSNTAGEADALEGLGRVFLAQGDYAAALDALELACSPKGRRATIATIRARRSSASATCTSVSATSTRRAPRSSKAARISRPSRIAPTSAATWQALALVDLVGQPLHAGRGRVPQEQRQLRGRQADDECVAGAVAGLAFAQTAQEKFADGIASYKKAIEAFTALKRVEQAARAEIGLSRALTQSGAHAAALAAASHARQEAERLVNDDVLWRAQVAEAAALRRLRERPKALAAATRRRRGCRSTARSRQDPPVGAGRARFVIRLCHAGAPAGRGRRRGVGVRVGRADARARPARAAGARRARHLARDDRRRARRGADARR